MIEKKIKVNIVALKTAMQEEDLREFVQNAFNAYLYNTNGESAINFLMGLGILEEEK